MTQNFKYSKFGLVLGAAALLVSCYKLGLNGTQSGEFSSQIPTSANSGELIVSYPSYSKVTNQDQTEQSEILVNPQADESTCEIVELTGPISSSSGLNVCETLPDLCWTNKLASVTRTYDRTCAQAFRAADLLKSRAQNNCRAESFSLSGLEKDQINNPSLYRIGTESATLNVQIASATAVIQQIDTITLESSCRCNYSSSNESAGIYKFPALEEHCRTYFSEVYR
ncbi:MAG: hypothetical protein RJB66_2581 [Pseudomonadota bacterium]|jgi:hypothetical protein